MPEPPFEVEHFVPTRRRRDAVGHHSLETERALREAGIPVRTWIGEADPDLGAPRYTEFTARPGRSLLLYEAATNGGALGELLLGRPEPLTLYHHNITPPEYFRPYDPSMAEFLAGARPQLQRMAERVRVALAASAFNAADLRDLGFQSVSVCPPYVPSLPPPDPRVLERLRAEDAPRLLFVGRVVPNKGHLDLLRMLAALRAAACPQVRLWICGLAERGTYMSLLTSSVERLGLNGAVAFTGSVEPATLAAYYAAADAFVCFSRHEGFGVPLVEAMRAGTPVVALNAEAVAETLGGAGLLLPHPDPLVAAETVARVVTDGALRQALVARQRQRAIELDAFPRDELIVGALRSAFG